ncbi:MAG: carboxypeptidase-like regulatory domain-containing protein [Planctomycetota bacterium]|nr:carboxypeptidase-like regulatory domain-containing protein [Planctomycetota bacterium]
MASSSTSLARSALTAIAALCCLGLAALAFLTNPAVEPAEVISETSGGVSNALPRLAPIAEGGAQATGSLDASARSTATRLAITAGPADVGSGAATDPERVVRLRVVAAETGSALKDVELVKLWDREVRLGAGVEFAPAEEGTFELRWRGGARVDAVLGAAGYDEVTLVELVDDPDRVVDVKLQRGATLSLDAEGFDADVLGLLIVFRGTTADGRAMLREEWRLGTEKVVHVPSGPLSVLLVVAGEQPLSRLGLHAAPGETLRLSFTAHRGELLRGRVVEKATRQPLAGVAVKARPRLSGVGKQAGRLPYPPVMTGEDGRFEIDGLPLGPLELSLEPSFGPPVLRTVKVTEGEAARTRDLAIGGAATISGMVHCGEGVDPRDLTVLIIAPGELTRLKPSLGGGGAALADKASRQRGAVALVAEDGAFSCRTAPSGRPIGVLAQSGNAIGYVRIEGTLVPGGERQGVVVHLERPEPAAFRIVNDLGEPVCAIDAQLRFLLSRAPGAGGGAAWSSKEAYEDTAGRFEVPVSADAVRRIRVSSPGHLSIDTSWPVVGGFPAIEPTFQMIASAPIEVLVHDEEGFAVKGARVSAWPARQSMAEAKAGGMLRSVRCSRRGRGALELDRAVQEWAVRADASWYRASATQSVLKGGADELRFTLEKEPRPAPGTIVGRLIRQGDGAPVPGLSFKGLRGGVAIMDGVDFELRGVLPGRVQIVAEAPGYESVRLPVDALQPGQKLALDELSTRVTARVRVEVRDRSGNRVRQALVRLVRLAPGRGGRTDVPKQLGFPSVGDKEGGFDRAGVPRGKWLLAVNRSGYARYREVVVIKAPTSQLTVTLTAAKGR